MTQKDLDNLSAANNDIRIAKQVIRNATGRINSILSECDHVNPDGTAAQITGPGYQFATCKICGRDEEYRALWRKTPSPDAEDAEKFIPPEQREAWRERMKELERWGDDPEINS